jgi:site-specific DNA recombinase
MTAILATQSAVGYFRVSSPGQAGERHVSLDVQKAEFNQYCRDHHLDSVADFTDVATGRKNDREQYMRMLERVAQGGISNIVVLFLDRFGRNPREILRRYWELQEHGVTVQSIHEDLNEELMLLIRAGIAGQESRRTGERVSMAMREAASRGKLMGRLPYGYAKITDRAGVHIEQVPEEATGIRMAYELTTVRNLGFKSVADELNRLGYRSKKGTVFGAETVKIIMTNLALVGTRVYKSRVGDPIVNEGVYPAILSEDEWDTLQKQIKIRQERPRRGRVGISAYLFTGTLRCGNCSGAMVGTSGATNKYYVCRNHQGAYERCPDGVRHRKNDLETSILEHLSQYSDPDAVRELLEAQGQETDNRDEAELTRVNARLGELEQGFLNDLDRVDRDILTEPEFLKRQQVRRREQEGLLPRQVELEASIAAQKDMESQAAAVPVKVRSFLEDFRDMEVPQAKAFLQSIIKAAHVFKDGRIELEFRP